MKHNNLVATSVIGILVFWIPVAQARHKSRYEAPIATILNDVSDLTGKAIIASIPGDEAVSGLVKGESKVKELLASKGLAWVEHDGIVRIVGKETVSATLKSLQEIAGDPWCKTLGLDEVNSDFPEPTDIIDISRAMSLWSDTDMIVPEDIRGKVRIVHDKKVSKQRFCQFWLAAMEQVGFKPVHSGPLTVIVPANKSGSWEWPFAPAGISLGEQNIDFDFPELVGVEKVLARYNELTREKITVSPETKSRVRVWAARKIAAKNLPLVLQVALKSAGLRLENSLVSPIAL